MPNITINEKRNALQEMKRKKVVVEETVKIAKMSSKGNRGSVQPMSSSKQYACKSAQFYHSITQERRTINS